MKIGSWILGMRTGNMGYIYFNLVFDKVHEGQEVPPALCEKLTYLLFWWNLNHMC